MASVASAPKQWGVPHPKKPNGVNAIKSKLLHPALTSMFYVEVPKPQGRDGGFDRYLTDNNIRFDQERLNLMCCEATLPGSNLATLELTNDRTGVTEKHAYRRVYDDRIDLTFYVNAENYLPIRYFEIWMKYIAQESDAKNNGKPSAKSKNYFYGFQYPDYYVSEDGLKVTKFEKSSIGDNSGGKTKGGLLTYSFVRCFPISISSMPIAYDSSNLLKCTVSLNYIRYFVSNTDIKPDKPPAGEGLPDSASVTDPEGLSDFKYDGFGVDQSGLAFDTPALQAGFNNKAVVNANSAYFKPESTSDPIGRGLDAPVTNAERERVRIASRRARDTDGILRV